MTNPTHVILFIIIASVIGLSLLVYADAQYSGNVGPLELQHPPIPTWIKHVFELWTLDKISDIELINAIQFLVDIEVIEL